jgi:hypothetical protein
VFENRWEVISVETYPEGVVKDKNNDTYYVSVERLRLMNLHAHGVTTSSAARKGSRMHSSGALFLSGGKPIYYQIPN